MTLTTTPAQIEGRLRSDLSGIASMWPSMFDPTAKRPRSGGGTGDGQTRLDDDSEGVADTPRMVLIIDIRREVLVTLRRWAEDTIDTIRARHKTPESARRSLGTIPERNDAEALCGLLKRFAAHLAQHPEAEVILKEIGDCWTAVNRVVHPFRKMWLSLGPCPLVYVDPADDVEKPCPGEVRSYGESHHGDSWARCTACSAKAVASWWEGRMFGADSRKPLTATEAVVWIHRSPAELPPDRAARLAVDHPRVRRRPRHPLHRRRLTPGPRPLGRALTRDRDSHLRHPTRAVPGGGRHVRGANRPATCADFPAARVLPAARSGPDVGRVPPPCARAIP